MGPESGPALIELAYIETEKAKPGAEAGLSASLLVAGAGFEPATFGL